MPEIERKWVSTELPNSALEHITPRHLLQGYIITWPGELRIRTDGTRHWMTVKSEGSLVRDEWEALIPDWTFNQLFATTAYQIEKLRYQRIIDGYTWEIDVYQGKLTGLTTIEVECRTAHQALALALPQCFGRAIEVTGSPHYKNKHLAVHGLPR